MRIRSALETVLAERDLEKVTADQYDRTLRRFEASIGRPADVRDLTVDNVNHFIRGLQEQLAPVTCNNYRRALLMLWNHVAATTDYPPYVGQRIRKPKVQPQIVQAWTFKQLRVLLAAAPKVTGQLRIGIKASDYLLAWLWVGFDTGMRPSDLRLLRMNQVNLHERCISIIQHKTSKPHTALLGEDSITALSKIIRPARAKLFPLSKGGMRRWERALFAIADSDGFCRRHGEGLGRLRVLHATEVYKDDGLSAAAESLGHVSGTRVVKAHYIDASAIHRGRLPRRPNDDRGSQESRAG